MNHKDVKYGILLTREQLDFLKDDNQGFHRMKAFDTFLSLAAIEPFHYEKKNFSADLDIGQFAISKVETLIVIFEEIKLLPGQQDSILYILVFHLLICLW